MTVLRNSRHMNFNAINLVEFSCLWKRDSQKIKLRGKFNWNMPYNRKEYIEISTYVGDYYKSTKFSLWNDLKENYFNSPLNILFEWIESAIII